MDTDIINDPVLQDLIEKRDGEPFHAYSAFAHFARLSEAERFATDVNAQIAGHFQTTVDQIKDWRKEWDWEQRASLIDAYGITSALSNTLQLLKENDKEFVQLNLEYKEKILSARAQLLDVLLDQIGKARKMDWKPSDVVAVYKAITQTEKIGKTNTLSLIDTINAQKNRISEMSDEEFAKLERETAEREKLLLIEGGNQ